MAKSKTTEPAKSKAQAIREAIEQLQAEGREITTATILALLPSLGVKNAKATDVYYSMPWKELREKEKSGEVAAEAAPAPPKEPALAEPVPVAVGITKGDAVRQALAMLGSDAKPKAVIEHVKVQHGLVVSYQTVLNVKGALGAKSVGAKRWGEPAQVEAVVVEFAVSPITRKEASGNIALEDIRAVKDLTERLGAEKLQHLADILA